MLQSFNNEATEKNNILSKSAAIFISESSQFFLKMELARLKPSSLLG